MIGSETTPPVDEKYHDSDGKEQQSQEVLKRAQEYVDRGKQARQAGDDATLEEINIQIKNDFAMINLANSKGINLDKVSKTSFSSAKDATLDEINSNLQKSLDQLKSPYDRNSDVVSQSEGGLGAEQQRFEQIKQLLHFIEPIDFPEIESLSSEQLNTLNDELLKIYRRYLMGGQYKGESRDQIEALRKQYHSAQPESPQVIDSSEQQRKRDNIAWHQPWETTPQKWRDTLAAIPEFKGDVENAIQLLTQFSAGMKKVWAKINQVQQDTFDAPPLAIYFGDDVESVSIMYDPKNNVIGIGRDFLANLSNIDPENIIRLNSNNLRGETIFIGKIRDYARLTGIEETQHAERNKRMNGIESTTPQQQSSLAEYDALDPEYEALLWQRDDAVEQNMPIPTIQYLNKRIENANKVIKMRKK